jgi:hypothetical protein
MAVTLTKDKAFAARYLAGEANAVKRFTRLHEVALAGQRTGGESCLCGATQAPSSYGPSPNHYH